MANGYDRDRAHACLVLCQTAIALMEQIDTEAGAIRCERDHRTVTKILERMQQKYLLVYEAERAKDRRVDSRSN